MNSTIERIDSTRIELQRDGRQYTGIKISPTSRPDIWNLRAGDTPDTAWIFRDGRIDEWPVEGYIENQGRYCLGPRFEGERLSRLISRGKFDLKTLRKVLLAYSAVYSSKKEPEHFDASSVFLLTDGGVMILSSSMAKKQRRCLSEEELLQDYEPFQHPDIKGPTALVYSFALLAYVALSNRHPFIDRPSSPGNNNEELRERMRRAEFVPLSIMKPEIFKDAAVYIDSILDGSAADPGLSELHEFLGRVETEPSPALSQAEILRMRDLVRRREKRIHRKSILRRFFRRHKVSLGIAGILLIAGVLLTVNIMQEASVPPPTRGMEPEQVVHLFYESMNSLDHDTMEACTVNGAGSRYIESAVRLTVITRVTKAYSIGGPSPFFSAQEWIDSGRPSLKQGQVVFGAADISIRKTAEEEFRVSYIFAQPAAGGLEEQEEGIRIRLSEQIEKVRLRREKEDYCIYSIEPVEIREIDSSRELKNE